MKNRLTRRLALTSALAVTAVAAALAPMAHADTLPGNAFAPVLPSAYANGCSSAARSRARTSCWTAARRSSIHRRGRRRGSSS
jgi:hypothetical protein